MEPDSTPEQEQLEELEAPELEELLEPQPEEPKPKRGPGRPRKEPQPEEPKRGPGRPRKEELKTPLKTPPRERGPGRREDWEERQLDPIAELTRLIKQRNEEQARQRKTAYANMLGL